MRSLPPVTRLILIANIAVFCLQLSLGDRFFFPFALWPIGPLFRPWQILSYGFLHANLTHVAFNMFAVYMFGAPMEQVWGGRRFLVYYLVCVVFAALAQLVVDAFVADAGATIGASGGVFGILLAFGFTFPRQRVMLLFPPIPMPAWLFVTFYGAVELFLGVTGTQAGVAHFAHLGGMLGGFLMIRRWRASAPRSFPLEALERQDE